MALRLNAHPFSPSFPRRRESIIPKRPTPASPAWPMDPPLRGDEGRRRILAIAAKAEGKPSGPLLSKPDLHAAHAARNDEGQNYRRISPNVLSSNHVASEHSTATIVATNVPPPAPSSGIPPVFIPKNPVTRVAGMNKAVITESR